MEQSFRIEKVLNNNVLIASHPTYDEVVLIGKGIGFGKKKGDVIEQKDVEKWFILKNEREQEQYKKLLPHVDEEFIGLMNDIIHHIQKRTNSSLNEHIHVALTDHILFAIKRLEQGMDIKNPFLVETKSLYPLEYDVATEVVNMLNERLHIQLPEGEIGFIALHIHSALTNHQLSEVNQHSQLISRLVSVVEEQLDIRIDRESIHYLRFVRHLRYAIERVKKGEKIEEPKKLSNILKETYPLCYNLSWKLIKIMQQTLQLPVDEAEAVYLTLHLQRLTGKSE
ncbi:transcription antiterminator [Anoxybacillus sp. LAT_35]|uniref:Transcriptional antiterminator n=1 Tax=Anoxybacillus flavithermus NBRC 109594 TaxID=1315967 RepID=R4G1C6_9BACL|nr:MULTISPECIES: transcription antiterminator [Anoxybacillus]MCG3083693.1 transcription antiterminator [Anoxybacillus sp. LAT27]MCG5025334.1 transcription antiterminator [Anoxybacillus flavithermus]MCG6171357.1 transcription antiterminator [Anoxybacillus sp. LAT_11]MCG6175265.1 transcription antiterminator [Anoxybacillus sp. LAT_31]MCG6179055.1 transcription antiterminator [Anoxybacillus sp. LAT_35]MCG6179358.1 transcription antiterminator [Anoxybacillus sp. LAT_33]MCL9969789.1 transcription